MDDIPAIFAEAIAKQVFSAAQCLAGRAGRRFYHQSFGHLSHDVDAAPVDDFSLFDLASLTKPIATTTLCMLAWQEKKLDLEAQVQDYLPEFRRKEALTVRQLLQHTAGFPAWLPLYEEVKTKGWAYAQTRDFFLTRLSEIPLEAAPSTQRLYSDLDFILLGFLLEKIEGKRLAELFWEKVALPLAMTHTMFHPLRHPEWVMPQNIVATELCPWRGRLLWGEVHDDNAHVLDGAAGHAGLFGNALDIEKFIHELLAARHDQGKILGRNSFLAFFDQDIPLKLGWDTPSLQGSQAGKFFSPQTSIGHLAFTGCSLWLDLADEKYAILLTNRVHPSRTNEAIKAFRPRIHDRLFQSAPPFLAHDKP